MANNFKTVPNQRIIEVNKQPVDKKNKYTINNLSALDEAASKLVTTGGFKLYFYLAKNQDKYCFAFSSSDFYKWSGLGKSAYTTAFAELKSKGYLIESQKQKNKYIFYDKPQNKDDKNSDTSTIDNDIANSGFIF